MSRKGTNLSSVRVLMAHPVALRDGPRASSNHYSLVNPRVICRNLLFSRENMKRFLKLIRIRMNSVELLFKLSRKNLIVKLEEIIQAGSECQNESADNDQRDLIESA